MNWLGDITWPAVLFYGLWRFAPVVERWAPPKPAEEVVIPDDLVAFANSYEGDWAKDDTLRAIMEKHGEYNDWNLVRKAFGLAIKDTK